MEIKPKSHSLTGKITPGLMRKAFLNVKRNRGAAGIDSQSIDMSEANLEQNLDALMRRLKRRTFVPKPARRTYIPKGKRKFRPLGIPCVRDRIAQEVLRCLLSPIFEPSFQNDSYGFRPGRNCRQAVERVLELRHRGCRHVLDADIKGFFDNIPRPVITAGSAAEAADGNILGLVEKFLRAGIMENGVFKPTTVGTPQGDVLSPLLADIALNFLDWHMDALGVCFVRYADDFAVLCRSQKQSKEVLMNIEPFLNDQLGLSLSPEKTCVTNFKKGFSFLGFDISSRPVKMRGKSVEKFKDKIRDLTRRSRNLNAEVIKKINRVTQGTANCFATPFSHIAATFRKMDQRIRMRLRCMKYKHKWRTDNKRLRLNTDFRVGIIPNIITNNH